MIVKGKTIVVTGAGNGVGRELALQYLGKGAKVAAIDIDMKGLEETKKLAGGHASLSLHQVNITDRDQVKQLAEDVVEEHGAVDGLVNNAGIIQPFIHVKDIEETTIDRVMGVNFIGTLNMVKAFLPYFMERPSASIVNVASMGGFLPVPGQTVYGASKAAVKLLTEGLAAELRDTNVTVSVVLPGGIATGIMNNSDTSADGGGASDKMMKILLTPERAASLIIDTMETGKACAYLGKDSKLMRFLQKISPKLAGSMMNKALGGMVH